MGGVSRGTLDGGLSVRILEDFTKSGILCCSYEILLRASLITRKLSGKAAGQQAGERFDEEVFPKSVGIVQAPLPASRNCGSKRHSDSQSVQIG